MTPSRKLTAKCCSLGCQLKYLHKKTNKGQFIICENCGEKRYLNPAKIRDGQVCCSVKCQGENRSGAKNPAWNGGTSRELYGIEFGPRLKEEIRKRDNYTCQFPECGQIQNGHAFPIHHVDYERKNNEKFNLITLCNPHHSMANYDRAYWQSYFQDLQEARLQ